MKFTQTGLEVYRRTYSRVVDGIEETWPDTVFRVCKGNLALVPERHTFEDEYELLHEMMLAGEIVPAGRQLYMTGVPGRQFLFNCHASHWPELLSEHFKFTFMRLMEGGGVGCNYSNKYLTEYKINNLVRVYLVCDKSHPDYGKLEPYLSTGHATHKILDDSREGWASAITDIINSATGNIELGNSELDNAGIETINIGFDLSNIRCEGSEIKTFGGTAAGPLPLAKLLHKTTELMNTMLIEGVAAPTVMELDHHIAQCVVSGNVRRSARMSIMHWKDPDIWWFLDCKGEGINHWTTNISVEIDDQFINIIERGDGYSILGRQAHAVYKKMCAGMLKNGEPGFWNSDRANEGEPNPVVTTNPCGEVSLQPWEACNLGHVNLAAFGYPNGEVDFERLALAHILMARFLVRSTYGDMPDPKQMEVSDLNRRIGVGHLGYQWYVNMRGIRYSESWKPEHPIQRELASLYRMVREAGDEYAFQLRIPAPVKVTAIAPTGSISKLFGVSSGIQPLIAKYFTLRVRYSSIDPRQIDQVEEYRRKGYNVVKDIYSENTVVVEIPTKDPLLDACDPSIVESADEISLHDMLSVQRMYQEHYADNGISFTINIPEGTVSTSELESALLGHLMGLKGTTVMVDKSRPLSPYERITEAEYDEYMNFISEVQVADSYGDGTCGPMACPVR